jgi:hypothetical protein
MKIRDLPWCINTDNHAVFQKPFFEVGDKLDVLLVIKSEVSSSRLNSSPLHSSTLPPTMRNENIL